MLTLKAPIITKADNNFDFFLFSEENKSGHFMESSAMIHMKYQDLFSLRKKKMKILDCRLLQILLGALRVKVIGVRLYLEFQNICTHFKGLCRPL